MAEEAKMALLLAAVGFIAIGIVLIYNYFNGKSN
jgi:preprotein translocase subunit Sss1